MKFLKALEIAPLPKKMVDQLKAFSGSLKNALSQKLPEEEIDKQLTLFLELVLKEIDSPTPFEIYHEREPFYTAFGKEFLRPLIDLKNSKVFGWDNVDKIVEQVENGENVILFANHQVEPDPQVISLLLEEKYKEFSESIIYVAGHRVTQDPLAIPFSRGCNLLCITSKKYIETPPEEKSQKLQRNMRTIKRLKELLRGGQVRVCRAERRPRPKK